MSSQELAQKLNETIKSWSNDQDKLVVAIDGYTGIGKTTLLNNLVAINPDILAVNRDDFLLPRKVVKSKLSQAKDKSEVFEREVNDDKKMEDFVNTFKSDTASCMIDTYDGTTGEVNIGKTYDFSKKVMVVEGVFMFHPELPLNKLWDKRIYLKGDVAKIDERRVKREKERWGKDYFPETHPDNYFRQVIIALKRYMELFKPEEVADLVLSVDY